MNQINVGVLGAGSMGTTVIEHLKQNPLVSRILAGDLSSARVKEITERYRIEATTEIDQILNDASISLVFITASNAAHLDLAIRAMRAGKAVMCEKPMATSLAEARSMLAEAETNRGFLQIGFELRYSKLYTQVKEWIDFGKLGDVVSINWFYVCSEFHLKDSWRNKKETGGSMFLEKICHYADLSRWWIGSEAVEVTAMCSPNIIPYYEVRDNYHTNIRFQSGAVTQISFMMAPGATFVGDPLQNVINQQAGDGHALRCLIVGTRGAAETNVFERTLKRWEFGDSPKCFTSTWVDSLTWDPADDHQYFHNTLEQTHDIVKRVIKGLPPFTNARDSYETMRLSVAVDFAADTGRLIRPADIE